MKKNQLRLKYIKCNSKTIARKILNGGITTKKEATVLAWIFSDRLEKPKSARIIMRELDVAILRLKSKQAA